MIFANSVITGSYDYPEVALSVLIAVAASYAALDLAGRVTAVEGRARAAWLAGGATAMGTGIWSMHFIGMLAFHLPVPVSYHWPTVLASVLVAILASALAIFFASRRKMSWFLAGVDSLLIGGGIAGMHYIGIASMRLPAALRFNAFLVCLSVLSAITFSFAAFLLAFNFREETRRTVSRRLASATAMGAAVSATHYVGMASVSFMPTAWVPDLSHSVNVSTLGTLGIASVTLMLLSLTVFMCEVGRRLEAQSKELESRVQERTSRLTNLNTRLTESEARLREFEKALEGLEEMVVVIDKEYRYVLANRAFLRHRGVEREQLEGHLVSELLSPGLFETCS
jgi:NO-binding membrane sensor protein with MHYT domain